VFDPVRWERRQDETETGRDDHRGVGRLHAPEPHEDPQVRAYRTGQARHGENGQPEDEGGLAPVLVGEAAGLVSCSDPAPVDRKCDAVDEAGVITGEEDDRRSEFLGLSYATCWC
jgi:hypothetical protein